MRALPARGEEQGRDETRSQRVNTHLRSSLTVSLRLLRPRPKEHRPRSPRPTRPRPCPRPACPDRRRGPGRPCRPRRHPSPGPCRPRPCPPRSSPCWPSSRSPPSHSPLPGRSRSTLRVSTHRPSPRYCRAGRGGGTIAPPPPAPTPPTPVVPGAAAAGGGGGLSSGSVSAAASYLGIASTSFRVTSLATMPPSGLTSTRSKSSATFLAPRPRKPPLAITSFRIVPLRASTTASLTLPSGSPSEPWTERPIMSAALTASPAVAGVAGARGDASAGGVVVVAGGVGVGGAPGPASWAAATLASSATAETAPSSSLLIRRSPQVDGRNHGRLSNTVPRPRVSVGCGVGENQAPQVPSRPGASSPAAVSPGLTTAPPW